MPGKRPKTFMPNLIMLLLTNDFVTRDMIKTANGRETDAAYSFKAPMNRARAELEAQKIILSNDVKKGWYVSAAHREKLQELYGPGEKVPA